MTMFEKLADDLFDSAAKKVIDLLEAALRAKRRVPFKLIVDLDLGYVSPEDKGLYYLRGVVAPGRVIFSGFEKVRERAISLVDRFGNKATNVAASDRYLSPPSLPVRKAKHVLEKVIEAFYDKQSPEATTNLPDFYFRVDAETNTFRSVQVYIAKATMAVTKRGGKTVVTITVRPVAKDESDGSKTLSKVASGHHRGNKDGGKEKVPDLVKHIAARLVKEKGYSKDRAFAIAVAHAQRIGAMRKGTMKLTKKGKGLEAKHERDRAAVDLKKVAGSLADTAAILGATAGLAGASWWASSRPYKYVGRSIFGQKDTGWRRLIPMRRRYYVKEGLNFPLAVAGIVGGHYVGKRIGKAFERMGSKARGRSQEYDRSPRGY